MHLKKYWNLAKAHSPLYYLPCWAGLYDTVGNNVTSDYAWLDGRFDFNLTSYYGFNSILQRCTYFYPGGAGLYDWYCNNQSLQIGYNSNSYDVAYCFVCNKPATRVYDITVVVSSDTGSRTSNTLWFSIEGSIENVTEAETWTEWFSRTEFNTNGATVQWTETLTNVGPVQKIIILLQNSNKFEMASVTVDGESYTNTGGIQLDYNGGMILCICLFLCLFCFCFYYSYYVLFCFAFANIYFALLFVFFLCTRKQNEKKKDKKRFLLCILSQC